MYTAFIIEDEHPASERLVQMLESHKSSIHVVGKAYEGAKAIEYINLLKPDVLFLDIHLPDMDGFEVLSKLDYQPMVIFTTAYLDYAIKAFEVFAVDYLLKPYDQTRLKSSIEKLSLIKPLEVKVDFKKMSELFYLNHHKKTNSTLAVKKGDRILLIDINDIIYCKAEDKYTFVYTSKNENHLCERSLSILEETLPEEFIRIHRSYLINKAYIVEIQKHFKGRLMIVMNDHKNTSLITSDSYTKEVKITLGIS